ncbi:hypothetical protein OS493_036978 [Desmophyllum pertusum]|uniref:Uncharacterized protein n=1 Tax=Desmophyllum pertusum TaxID=174260 RepID=A0A9W9YUQ0_9CNID|nr:hypothetical protein OS493_036978 [Desmophyllum pertusum]
MQLEFENETIHCRIVENGHPVNRLVGHKAVEYAHAEALSSNRELKAVADTMGIGALKPGQVKGTRWLPHVSRALKSLIKPPKGDPQHDPGQYAAVLQHMEHLASASKNPDITGRAKCIVSGDERDPLPRLLPFPG